MLDFRRLALFALICSLSLFGLACSDDSTGPGAGGTASGVGPYLQDLPTWAEFSPPLEARDEISGEGEHYTDDVDDTIFDCKTTPYSLTENPDKVVTLDPDANVLWLGALLQGKGYKDGIGSLAELPIRERAPLRISVDLLTDDNMRLVQDPSLATVQQAIGEIVSEATAAGHHGGSSVSFSQEQMHSVDQASLKLGLSAGYMSVSVKASLGASRTAEERTVTAYFVQKMFTASVELPESPTDLFSSEFTNEVLDEHIAAGRIGADNLPVYVASVTYGRILMFSFTSSANITDIRAALSATFSSLAGAEIEARYLDLLTQARISVVTVGGEGKNATALIQSGDLHDYFNEESALTSARPISYTVRNLGDNSLARVSETTEYNITECVARPQTGELQIDVTPNNADISIDGPTGYHEVLKGDQHLRDLEPGGYTIRVEKLDDPNFIPEEQEVDVVAGELTDVHVLIAKEITAGGEFEVTLVKLVPTELGCTWESAGADLFYSFDINSEQGVVSRSEANAITVAEGQAINFPPNTTTLQICDGERLTISGSVADADVNAADPVADFDTSYIYHDIPEGTKSVVGAASSCRATLTFRITRTADFACRSAVQGSFVVSRRPMPLFVETWTPVEPQWWTTELARY